MLLTPLRQTKNMSYESKMRLLLIRVLFSVKRATTTDDLPPDFAKRGF